MFNGKRKYCCDNDDIWGNNVNKYIYIKKKREEKVELTLTFDPSEGFSRFFMTNMFTFNSTWITFK